MSLNKLLLYSVVELGDRRESLEFRISRFLDNILIITVKYHEFHVLKL